MALDKLTIINNGGLSTTSDYRVGVLTATKFVGPIESESATFTGSVSIGGTLTYEDVTNVDSVGVITARKNIHVGGTNAIVGTPYSYFYGRGSGGDGVSVYAAEPSIELVGTNGGSHAASLLFRTAAHDGIGFNYNPGGNILELKSFDATNNNFQIHGAGNNVSNLKKLLTATSGAGIELYHNDVKKLQTSSVGISIPQNLDVDGHTNLDNVSIAGVTTADGNAYFKGNFIELNNSADSQYTLNKGGTQLFSIRNNSTAGVHINTQNSALLALGVSTGSNNGSVETTLSVNYQGRVGIRNIYPAAVLDVNGETHLDNVIISGVTTTTGNIDANGDLDVDGHTNLDNVSVAGVTTFTGRSDHSSHINMLAGNNIVLQNESNSANCQIDCYGGAGFRLTSYNQTMFTCENGSNTKLYTNSGTSRLEITHAGDVLVNTGTLHIPDALTHSGDTDTKIRFPYADTITAETGGVQSVLLNSSGALIEGRIKQNNTNNTVFPTSWGTYAYTPYPHELELDNNQRGTQGSFAGMYFVAGADSDGSKVGTARISAVETGNYKADLVFSTRNTAFTEKLRINSAGQLITGGNANPFPTRVLTLQPASGQTNNYISIIAGNTSSVSGVTFGTSADNNANNYRAMFEYYHSGFAHNEGLRFLSAGTEALRIRGGTAAGDILYGPGDHHIGASPGLINGLGSHNNANPASVLFGINDGGGYNGMKVINFDDGTYNSQRIEFLTGKGGVSMATVRMGIDENGLVSIGRTISANSSFNSSTNQLVVGNGVGNQGMVVYTGASHAGSLIFNDVADGTFQGGLSYKHGSGSNDNSLKFYANADERLRITSNGQVRIANTDLTTSSKADNLIVGTTSGDTGITIFSGSGNTGNIYFGDTNTSGVENRMGTITYVHSQNYMRFSTNGNQEKVRIDSSGRVQIASNAPANRSQYNNFDGPGRLNINNNQPDGTVDFTQGIVFTDQGAQNNTWTHGGIVCTGSTGYNGNLCFGTDGDGAQNTTGITERLRITSGGDTELRNNVAGINDSYSQYLKFRTTQSNGQSAITGAIRAQGKSNWGGDLVFYSKPANGTPNDSVSEQMRITRDGQINAATKSFVSKFHYNPGIQGTGGWSTNWNTIIPGGTLNYNDTYVITAYWQHDYNGGSQGYPYLMQASFLFSSVSVNNTTGGNVEFVPFQTAHVGGSTHRLIFRFLPIGGHSTAGVQVKNPAGFHATYGGITVKAFLLGDY